MTMKIGPKKLKNRNHVRKWWVLEVASEFRKGYPMGNEGFRYVAQFPCRSDAEKYKRSLIDKSYRWRVAELSPSHMKHAYAGRIA